MTTTAVIVIVVAVIALAAIGWLLYRQRRSKELRARFGPEYSRTVDQYGNASKAEDALAARARRMERIHIRSLSRDAHQRFAEEWQAVQRGFVDNPAGSIQQADALVSEVMRAEGYPMADFEHRAEDISVDHPEVVQKYRLAHAISERQAQGKAGTEDLRQAVIYYRDLFDDLLETHPTERTRR
jgi:FtsZ-interacting cell division protein ZipA